MEQFSSARLAADLKKCASSLPISSGRHKRKFVFVARQNVVAFGKHFVVDRRFDVKDVAVFVNQFSEFDNLVIQNRFRRIHIRIRIANRLRFVMLAQRFVIAQPDRDRFMSAVHRHEIDIQINQNIAFDGAFVDSQRFVVARFADVNQILRRLPRRDCNNDQDKIR